MVATISSHCNNRSGDGTKQFDASGKIIFTIISNAVKLHCSLKSKKTLLIRSDNLVHLKNEIERTTLLFFLKTLKSQLDIIMEYRINMFFEM